MHINTVGVSTKIAHAVPVSLIPIGGGFHQNNTTLVRIIPAGRVAHALSDSEDIYGHCLATGKFYALKEDHMVVPVEIQQVSIYRNGRLTLNAIEGRFRLLDDRSGREYTRIKNLGGFLANSNLMSSVLNRGDCIVLTPENKLEVMRGDVPVIACGANHV